MIELRPKESQGNLEKADALANALGIAPLCARLLCARGYDDIDSARAFVRPDLSMLHDPFAFEGMQDAVDCICAAGEMGETICVYGDYDADGICGTAILARYLKTQGFEVLPYIPERHNEGYGLNKAAIEQIASRGVGLLITVDCGITAREEIALAYELGMEVVLTDHHQCPPILPECEAIVNPQCGAYPFRHLCGTGVAFKLVQALGGIEAAAQYLDLAAIATVADIVSLTDENRVIVSEGLKRIAAGQCVAGVRALAEVSGCPEGRIDAGQIGFGMAPRINATGRTGSASQSLQLFLTDDPAEARRLALGLDTENKRRQQIEAGIHDDALRHIAAGQADPARDPVIVLRDDAWNCGVIGIVASRLTRRYHRPVLLFGGEEGQLTASGRSIPGVHLYDSLSKYRERFVRFGGHEMAAGLTIEAAGYDAFRAAFLADMRETLPVEVLRPVAYYDAEIAPSAITEGLVDDLAVLAPFGTGHHAPVFCVRGETPQNVLTMGSEHQHLRFTVGGLACVAFGEGQSSTRLRNERVDLLVTADRNHFNGKTSVQALVKAMRFAPPEELERYVAARAWKFYDALCCRIGYNKSLDNGEFSPCVADSGVRQRYLDAIRHQVQGKLAICFTPEGALDLLHTLRREGLIDAVDLHWGRCADESAYNAVLFAPEIDPDDLRGFDQIAVWDDCPDAAAWREIAGLQAQSGAYGMDVGAFLERIAIPRDRLGQAYRAIGAEVSREGRYTDFDAYATAVQRRTSIDPFLTVYATRVFSQLGLIAIKREGCFDVSIVPAPPKRDLEGSPLYNASHRALESYRSRVR